MTDTVQAPTVEPTAEAEAATAAKAPVSTKDKITKALSREMPPLHTAFIEWMQREGGVTLDATSVLATQSLYNVYRQTEEFKNLKDTLPKSTAGKVEALPQTAEEAKAMLEKHAKAKANREAAAARADERARKIQELLASMQGGEAGEVAEEATDVAETDEEIQEAF
jgi:hypothetical protein